MYCDHVTHQQKKTRERAKAVPESSKVEAKAKAKEKQKTQAKVCCCSWGVPSRPPSDCRLPSGEPSRCVAGRLRPVWDGLGGHGARAGLTQPGSAVSPRGAMNRNRLVVRVRGSLVRVVLLCTHSCLLAPPTILMALVGHWALWHRTAQKALSITVQLFAGRPFRSA